MPSSPDDEIPRLKAELFRTLGHPARVRILEVLCEGERSVGELQAILGADSSRVSQHLAVLRRQGLVDSRRAGTSVRYHVKEPRALQLMEIARQILSAQVQAAQALLDDLATPTPTTLVAGHPRA